jgi:hypothetical protein
MSSRGRGICYLTLAAALALSGGACNGQAPNDTRNGTTMSNPPAASRPPAANVEPIVYKGVRYEQDRVDAAAGDQNGGYLAAVDPTSGQRLWRLQVYSVPDQSAQGVPNMGRYFRSMRLVPGRDELEIENEAGGRYLVDLNGRSVTTMPGSTPETQPTAPPTNPKPTAP